MDSNTADQIYAFVLHQKYTKGTAGEITGFRYQNKHLDKLSYKLRKLTMNELDV